MLQEEKKINNSSLDIYQEYTKSKTLGRVPDSCMCVTYKLIVDVNKQCYIALEVSWKF